LQLSLIVQKLKVFQLQGWGHRSPDSPTRDSIHAPRYVFLMDTITEYCPHFPTQKMYCPLCSGLCPSPGARQK